MKNMRNARRVIALGLIIVLVVLMGAGSQKSDPSTIHIRNAEDLHELSVACKFDAYSRDKTVILDNDIDLTGETFTPIPTFGGTFDGKGHTISGLSLSGDGAHMGLFRYVQSGGTVQDLTVSGTVDSAGTLTEIGAIVGTNMGTITGCNFSGSISGKNNVGGIAGTNESGGMIYNCKSEGFVAGDHYVGGTVGQNLGTVSYCSNTAGVNVNTEDVSVEPIDEISLSDDSEEDTKEANTSTDVGGIVGFSSGVVIGCTNWGTVGFQHVGYNVGGIAGRQSGLVTGCTNWGVALGRKDVGGIVGQMEPYIELDSGAGSIGKLEKDLNTLHDQMNVLLGHAGAAASDMSATLGSISAAAGRATEHARFVAERTMDYVEETGDTVNEAMIRINTSEKMVAPAIAEFSQGSIQLEIATGYFSTGFDELDAIDEMTEADKANFKSSAKDLTDSADKLNAAMAYLGWLMKAADNSYGTGNYDLESERPENWQHDAEMYGYEYNPAALTSYETIRDAMLRGAGDASSAAGAISGDVSTMTKVINTYYLTEDENGNTRLDNMSAAFKSAFDSLQQSTGHLSTGMSYLDQMAGYLSGNDPLVVPGVDSDYRTEMEGVFNELSSISSGLSRLATQTAGYSNLIIGDMRAVNDTFNVVMLDLCDILQLALDPDAEDIIEDVSEEDYASINTGKVYNCQNYGTADGDVAVGGIAGTMAIEFDFDPESDSTILSETSLTSKYFTKCVLMDSTNYGTAVSRKDYAGGICGESDLGVIVGCEGYGSAESKLGNYVGGIAGMSKGSVRDCYAKCELTGDNYVGGVAGFGKNISDCSTLMNLNTDGNCVGTIAGELDDEGEASGNYFVHDSQAGIDGISYEGKAEALSYEDFMKRDGVPAEFSSFTATFTANGEVVKTIVFAYGASIDESEIPECPVVEGNYGKWPDFDYNNLTFDVEIRAEYAASASSVSGNLVNDDGTPVVILEGVFDPAAKALVTQSRVDGPDVTGDREIIGKYDVHVEDDSLAEDADRAVSVRVNAPKGGSYNIYTYRDGKWENVSYTRDGSYLVFDSPDRDVTFAVTRSKHGPLLYILLGLALCALLVGGIRALLKRKRRKAAETETVVPEDETLASERTQLAEDVENAETLNAEIDRNVETIPAVEDHFKSEVETVEADTDLPEIAVEAPAVEVEMPAVEVETPAVEAEAPAVEAEAPAVEIEAPAVEIETPDVEIETPSVEAEAPAIGAAAATVAAAAAAAPEKKRGLFGFLRRKNKKAEAAEEAAAVVPAPEKSEPVSEEPDVDLKELVDRVFDKTDAAEVEAPVVEVEESVVEVEAPVVEVEEPIVEVEEPAVEVEEPVVEVEESVVEVEAPVVEVEEPVIAVEKPVVEVEEPVAEAEAPVAEVEEPAVEVEAPIVEAEKPAVEVEASSAEAEAPVIGAAAATVAAAAAAAPEKKRGLFGFLHRKNKKAEAAEEAAAVVPAPEKSEPVSEEPDVDLKELVDRVFDKTDAAEVETPVVAVEEPVVEVEEPVVEAEAPVVEVEEPVVEVEEPVVEVEEPVVEVEEPVVEVEEPVVEAEAPVVEVEVPAAEPTSLETFIADIRSSIADLPEDTTIVETADDEIPLFAVPVAAAASEIVPEVSADVMEPEPEAETPAVDTTSLDNFIASIRSTLSGVETEAPAAEAEAPEAEREIPEVEAETPVVEAEVPETDTTSLDAFIADIRSSIAELPETDIPAVAVEAPAVETEPDEVPLVAVPYVEEAPAVEAEAPAVETEPDEVPLVAVPYVEEAPAVEAEAPAIETEPDEVPLVAVPYVEEAPAVEAEVPAVETESDEVPLVAVPYAEEAPAAEPSSLDQLIANVRSSIADLPDTATVVETEDHEIPLFSVPYEQEEEPVGTFRAVPVSPDEVPLVAVPYEAPAEAELPVREPTSLETFIADIRSSIADLPSESTVVKTTATEIPLFSVPYVEEEKPAAAVEAEPEDDLPPVAVPYVEEAPANEPEPETHESLDDVIRFVRETCADVERSQNAPVEESHESLEELIAQVRGTISDVQAEPTTDSLDDVIRFVKDNVPDDEA